MGDAPTQPPLMSMQGPINADDAGLVARIEALEARYRDHSAADLLSAMASREFPQKLSLVSSFGADSAVLLHLAAAVKPDIDIVFIDTKRLFGETKRYRDQLVERLGLTGVRTVQPRQELLDMHDPDLMLFRDTPNRCCFIRKVEPLQRALDGIDAWISGRKRFQSDDRARLPRFEAADGRIKINPLAEWSKADLDAYFARHDLPHHPLVAEGYLSIGCLPCTDRVQPGEDARAGRWRGRDKSECGIHLSADRIAPDVVI